MSSASFAGRLAVRIRLPLAAFSSTTILLLALYDVAAALPCLEDRFGSSVNCTANDVRITDFHDVVVTDDGCTSLSDTVTFNAVLTVVTTATSRYDIGVFIGSDGEQALHGQCHVQALPTSPEPYKNLDKDACGDTSSSMIVTVPVTGVTVSCADANQNGLLDVATCTSWQQNGLRICSSPADLVPGTAAKCNCPLIPLDIDIPVPELVCETDADCADRAPGCNDGVCDAGHPDADGFGCISVPDHASCADNKYCNGAEICSPSGDCTDGPPVSCNDGIHCTNDTCNEASDSCVHTPNDALCNNGQFCDGVETCSARTGCNAGTPVACNDSIPCTTDACNEETDSCTSTPNDGFCDDGKFCNGPETCSPSLGCQDGPPALCNDSIPCTSDACSPQTDSCISVPDDSSCNDANACTADACDAVNGCSHTPTNGPCTDGNPCTPIDLCTAGQCIGTGTVCGNAVVDAGCGETCDPGNDEICDNLTDDDGDGLIDCADPDCRDAVVPTCTETCTAAPPCVPLLRDPAVIRVPQLEESSGLRASDETGTFTFHGRMIPESPMNPLVDGFAVTLTNANGEIYRAEVRAVDFESSGNKRFFFRADDTGRVRAEGGIAKLRVRQRGDGGQTAYAIRVTAYGDFSRATLPIMTTQVYFGDDVAYLTASWNAKPGRWTLYPSGYDDEP